MLKEWSTATTKVDDMALYDVLKRRQMSQKWREPNEMTRQKLYEINMSLNEVLKAPLAPIDTQTVVKFVGNQVVVYYPNPTAQQVVLQLENDSVAIQVAESVLMDE